jgi:O-methyltransferase domain
LVGAVSFLSQNAKRSYSDEIQALASKWDLANAEVPPSGKGRGYALALRLVVAAEKRAARRCLDEALSHYARAATEFNVSFAAQSLEDACLESNKRFDMDWIIGFSDAWQYWEDTSPESLRTRIPLDQLLFDGRHPRAAEYHRGIHELASRQRRFVRDACRMIFKRPAGTLLDLGSGSAAQVRMLLEEGLISAATCVEHPIVAELGRREAPEVAWLGGDLRTMSTELIPEHDAIWLGNLLHHYSSEANTRMLRRFRQCLRQGGRVIIQEYLAGERGDYGLVSATFGVHFALTTEHGRTFTLAEITGLLRRAFGRIALEHRVDGRFSSLLVYRVS